MTEGHSAASLLAIAIAPALATLLSDRGQEIQIRAAKFKMKKAKAHKYAEC